MMIGFMIWSIVTFIFLIIGISCFQSKEAVGFFTFVKPPVVKDVKSYNHSVSFLWFGAAVLFEMIGIPILFAEQNSPIFVILILAVVTLIIAMIITFFQIERKYKIS